MPERKRKRRFFNLFSFGDEDFLFGSEPTEGESGYSMSVTYDGKGKPVVQAKIYGDMDTAKLRRDIKQRYPGAKIEELEKKPLIRIIDEDEEEKKKSEAEKGKW